MRNDISSLAIEIKNPTSFIMMLGFAFLLFDLQYYIMSKLPGIENEMCIIGAGLNISNIVFAILISLMAGVFIVGFYKSYKNVNASVKTLSISGFSSFVGAMTIFCATCAVPVISIFGLAIGLGFFSEYNAWFKIISLLLMLFGLYRLNIVLKGECERCVE